MRTASEKIFVAYAQLIALREIKQELRLDLVEIDKYYRE